MTDKESPYPLSTWRLEGFKAIREDTELVLGGLNILVGSNSAGKSSVLQSILLAAQSLGTPLADRPLVLNGPLVRLGLAEDCVHEDAEKKMAIGFELGPSAFSQKKTNRSLKKTDATRVWSSFEISKDGTREFQLMESSLQVESDEAELCVTASKWNQKDALAAFRKKNLRGGLATAVAKTHTFRAEGDLDPRTVGLRVRQFLPTFQVLATNLFVTELESLRASLMRTFVANTNRPKSDRVLSPEASTILRRFAEDTLDERALAQLGSEKQIPFQQLGSSNYLRDFMQILDSEWFESQGTSIPHEPDVDFETFSEPLSTSIDDVRSWFAANVRHLGPLRASPQPLYNLPEAASGYSVGRNGEYTAAVLDTYGNRLRPYPMPDGRVRRTSLGAAVNAWMSQLGLVEAIQTTERGKLGYEYSVSVSGVKRELDLTTVGVGVSQALPVVVLGLVSEPGTLLMYEQPELHLHPDVQANLGDFFLALTASGRQLIVETHSEYFINRLRRRQAGDPESKVRELTRLFFFERNGNSSSVSPATIGIDGSMPSWPRGFLDTAAREMRLMLRESRAQSE